MPCRDYGYDERPAGISQSEFDKITRVACELAQAWRGGWDKHNISGETQKWMDEHDKADATTSRYDELSIEIEDLAEEVSAIGHEIETLQDAFEITELASIMEVIEAKTKAYNELDEKLDGLYKERDEIE